MQALRIHFFNYIIKIITSAETRLVHQLAKALVASKLGWFMGWGIFVKEVGAGVELQAVFLKVYAMAPQGAVEP